MTTTAVECAVVALAAVVAVCVALLVRVRMLARRVGAFECALRLVGERRWMSGIAVFGDEAVEWYRLISLHPRPKYRLTREGMTLGEAHHRGVAGHIVDVACSTEDHDFDLGMLEDSHSALVAWLEAAAPTQPTLF